MHRPSVELGSLAADGGEALAIDRVEHHPDRESGGVLEGDAYGPGTHPVQKVHRSIQWVDDPGATIGGRRASAFLSDDAVLGVMGGDDLADRLLRLAVGVRHRVGGGGLDVEALGRPPEVRHQHLAGGPSGPFGQGEVVRHETARTSSTIAVSTPTTTATQTRKRNASCSDPSGFSIA